MARKSENPGRQDRVDQGKPRRPDIGEELRNRPAERARQADGDRDGALSREEADKSLPGLARHFDRIDADRNGSVSPEEVRAFREQRRQQRMDRDSGDPRY